jgi:ribonucleoside-diphosphate reductase alpha chain
MYNGASAKTQVEKLNEREKDENQEFIKRREPREDFGTNPCSEIILRSREFCNLSECIVRRHDTTESLIKKVRIATILGTFQSTLTNFRYLTKEWERNCSDERLLGVSLTGILDNPLTSGRKKGLDELLQTLRKVAVDTNKEWADKLGVKRSAAITCVKPSGTVSQLVDSASGIHARHSPYYIRTVRADNKDPLCQMMKESGFPNEPDVTKPNHTTVFSFPTESPKGAICRTDMTAIEQLELWSTYQEHWCEHKPSITVTVKDQEWPEVGSWVWENFDDISGISFLPFSDHTYRQAPYQDCTKIEYDEMLKLIPKDVDWSTLSEFEQQDFTAGSQELACSADGGCEIVDI